MKSTVRKFEILLALVISARATSFLFSKILLEDMETFNLLAVRFLLAFILLAVIFCKTMLRSNLKTLVSGVVIGILYFVVMALELTALKTADSSLVALLENCAIIFVPIFETLLLKYLPGGKMTVITTLMAMTGVVFLTFKEGAVTIGIVLSILAAVVYAIGIIVTGRLMLGRDDSMAVGIIHVGVIGTLSLIVSLFMETPRFPCGVEEWVMLGFLVVVCTGFGFTLQPVAQSHVPPERAGLFCALSPGVAVLLGALLLGECLDVISIIGMLLILGGLVLPYIFKGKSGSDKAEKGV